jgi:hypothetical protein
MSTREWTVTIKGTAPAGLKKLKDWLGADKPENPSTRMWIVEDSNRWTAPETETGAPEMPDNVAAALYEDECGDS